MSMRPCSLSSQTFPVRTQSSLIDSERDAMWPNPENLYTDYASRYSQIVHVLETGLPEIQPEPGTPNILAGDPLNFAENLPHWLSPTVLTTSPVFPEVLGAQAVVCHERAVKVRPRTRRRNCTSFLELPQRYGDLFLGVPYFFNLREKYIPTRYIVQALAPTGRGSGSPRGVGA
ncbi:hypothetical protein CROQUDRAFT_87446 [Cronartium quercuum f. sp. fusiforme G11]|uniref:Uncharacterized protein n=1 Tax=Cronartium quercuum f. sp. fusiforme G11 TaxID=708437 RepID=A0A9P6TG16_9BASI|nr:hypothetical protein CROQUDRAFT_87446 [Cronartium quercuum f. sp. fusiforme G11]